LSKVENMFAPVAGSPGSNIPFERCMRVYGYQQDTGGFFIAILEKRTEFRAKPESESKKDGLEIKKQDLKRSADQLERDDDQSSTSLKKSKIEEPSNSADSEIADNTFVKSANGKDMSITNSVTKVENDVTTPAEAKIEPEDEGSNPQSSNQNRPQQRNRAGQQFEEPFKYISGDHAEVKSIESFYKLSPRFPRDRFMVRNASGEPAKTIYYTSALIRDILTENEGKGIKFIHGGVKMFMKQDVQSEGVCKWRIQSEGMPILEGYVGEERVVRLYKKETLRKLLIEMFPKLSDGAWKGLGEIGERVNEIGMGCCVLRIEPSSAEDGFDERIVLPLWRSLHSLNLM
jgi:multisite-specific tRNA:(cytosine-C5)-methyltransferase